MLCGTHAFVCSCWCVVVKCSVFSAVTICIHQANQNVFSWWHLYSVSPFFFQGIVVWSFCVLVMNKAQQHNIPTNAYAWCSLYIPIHPKQFAAMGVLLLCLADMLFQESLCSAHIKVLSLCSVLHGMYAECTLPSCSLTNQPCAETCLHMFWMTCLFKCNCFGWSN